jgi:predicted sulfurtransferase
MAALLADNCLPSTHLCEQKGEGVLLFYVYTFIPDVKDMIAYQKRWCNKQGLKGRVRVAQEGMNVTLSGSYEGLLAYSRQVSCHESFTGRHIDFKFAPYDPDQGSQMFATLRVRRVRELVTLGTERTQEDLGSNGVHVSPIDFHKMLLNAVSMRSQEAGEDLVDDKEIVILDTRSLYESRILTTLLPSIRQYRDLPQYIDGTFSNVCEVHT